MTAVPRTDEPEPDQRDGIVTASWVGTAAFGVTSALGAVVSAVDVVALAVALLLFVAGTVAFFAAYARAVTRSRTERIGVLSMFFLEGTVAPKPTRRLLLASFAVEVAVAAATAAARPNTSLAFGILAPVYGLALAGLWGARHGTFATRER